MVLIRALLHKSRERELACSQISEIPHRIPGAIPHWVNPVCPPFFCPCLLGTLL
jgi:hypothetical protein